MHYRQHNKPGWITIGFLILVSLTACSSFQLTADPSAAEEITVNNNSETVTLLNKDGWKLVTLENEQGVSGLVLPEAAITLLFQDDRLAGRSGCNNYFSAYTVDGSKLAIDKPGLTMMACPEAVMKQEFNYLTLLSRTAGYHITENQLQLFDNAGEIKLSFVVDEPAELSDGIWQLNVFNTGNALMSNLVTDRINITLAEGKLNGFAGCNVYSAKYNISEDKISFSPMKTTRKNCNYPESVMATEQGYFAALERTASYKIKGNQLTFFDEKGTRVVVYNKQK
jgi:heat shock protein HslJ